jgi:methylglutaconyl-CoA hydratase
MKSMARYGWEDHTPYATRLADMLWAIYSCPLPVVGRLHGDCYAGGMGLAACCDVLVAARDMHFCLSEARIGLLPATIGPYVVRGLGEQAARRYFITGEKFDALKARDLGFVHEVVQTDQLSFQSDASLLDSKVNEIVGALVSNGPAAVKACKRLVKDIAGRDITSELRAETARRIADIRASDEGREGVQAFLNKREPAWR